ncbi:hypothetical protein J2S43_002613 [Catenuloplanes nepalensis]|uniref:MalT-like TPR region domain-containing protein n=1 Tax=Catenuloplanes nepalensis TaxID=587533 RepID=A0ABT9MS38_9ACTN|nr:tetratricopeptide repeat protein [Catenuloplanes nepalensis]MDP9794101.1 hypothetical protein [Catenuloplanes nepalensis]
MTYLSEARAALRRGDTDTMQRLSDVELVRARDAGDLAGEVEAISMLARTAMFRGDYGTARRLAGEAADRAGAGGDPALELVPVHVAAAVELVAGDLEKARDAFTRSLALNERWGDARTVAREQFNLATIALKLGDAARATELLFASRRHALDAHDTDAAMLTHHAFAGAILAEAQGDTRLATRRLAAVESVLAATGEVLVAGYAADQAALRTTLRERLGADFDAEYAAGAGQDIRELLTAM